MKYTLLLLIVLVCFSCQNEPNSANSKNPVKIKICKVYSSDFGLLDTDSPGQLIQEFHFNKDGHVRELRRFGSDGKIINRFEIDGETSPFPLDKSNEFIDTTVTNVEYGTMGDTRKKEVKTYNKNGLLVEVKLYNQADSLKQKNTYEYNKEGYISKDIYWDIELNIPIEVINYRYEYNPN